MTTQTNDVQPQPGAQPYIDVINLARRIVFSSTPRHIGRLTQETTVLSVGCGQDSIALLYLIALVPEFRRTWAPGRVLAIFSETGDEHPETIEYAATLRAFCDQHNIEFQYLSLDRGYHPKSWSGGLTWFYRRNNAIGSIGYVKSCTENLKIVPIYNYLAEDFAKHYGGSAFAKTSFDVYNRLFGKKIRVIIGIAAGEDTRIENATAKSCKKCAGVGALYGIAAIGNVKRNTNTCKRCKGVGIDPPRHQWMVKWVERVYPLHVIGWDRKACQNFIRSVGKPLPPPSNCLKCPFKNEDELVWTFLVYPEQFAEWCQIEQVKLRANSHMNAVTNPKTGRIENRNYGVKKLKTLMQVVNARLAHYHQQGWTNEQILAHVSEVRMSHGHCVSSRY